VTVTRRRLDLQELVSQGEHSHVEGAPAQVKNQHALLLLRGGFVQTIGYSRCCRLIYDSNAVQSSYLSSVLGSLSLIIIEVCRDSDNRIGYFLFYVVFDALLQFEKNGSRNFLGVEFSLLTL